MQIRGLQQRLGEFGLNPVEWCIEILSHQAGLTRLLISRRDDRSTTMEGWALRGRWLTVAITEL
jgi:hypothetical protein